MAAKLIGATNPNWGGVLKRHDLRSRIEALRLWLEFARILGTVDAEGCWDWQLVCEVALVVFIRKFDLAPQARMGSPAGLLPNQTWQSGKMRLPAGFGPASLRQI